MQAIVNTKSDRQLIVYLSSHISRNCGGSSAEAPRPESGPARCGYVQLALAVLAILCITTTTATATQTKTPRQSRQLTWHDDYARAMDAAERQGKMMFILFCAPNGSDDVQINSDSPADKLSGDVHRNTIDDAHRRRLARPEIQEKLCDFVCVELPLDARISLDGKQVTLLDLPAFSEMLGRQGMAIIDFAHKKYHGDIVSMFPLYRGRAFAAKQILTMLDLPCGTLTQRTLIYAVRTHPERPGSADGKIRNDLVAEAQSHSCYQADIQLQGHHRWDSRFRRICAGLPCGLTASEVCAESWPGEGLLAAAIECVRCWRLSSGHWRAVRQRHPCYGYDMKRGRNGVWYATGIFGKRR